MPIPRLIRVRNLFSFVKGVRSFKFGDLKTVAFSKLVHFGEIELRKPAQEFFLDPRDRAALERAQRARTKGATLEHVFAGDFKEFRA